MKLVLLLIISIICIDNSIEIMGKCGMAPKYRPLECYKNSVLPEDLDELTEILERFRDGGDDNEFADLLGDMFDKKRYREKGASKVEEKRKIGNCGMHPKYLPVECYEQNILRRDKKLIKDAYNKYHENNLKKFNEIYNQLIEKKNYYYKNPNK